MSVWPSSESGLVLVHAAPKSLLLRITASIKGVLGDGSEVNWMPLPGYALKPFSVANSPLEELFSCSASFKASDIQLPDLASELSGFRSLWFETSVPATSESLGERFCFTPVLGLFHSQLDQAGNQVFGENQIMAVMRRADPLEPTDLESRLNSLLGVQWDDELEQLRQCNLKAQYLAEIAS
jgi:hypothetical protein